MDHWIPIMAAWALYSGCSRMVAKWLEESSANYSFGWYTVSGDFVVSYGAPSVILLPDMPILGSLNWIANRSMMSKLWTNGNTVVRLSRKQCGKWRNYSLGAISPFPTIFSKAVCCWCVKMSTYGVKVLMLPLSLSDWNCWRTYE